MNPSPQPADTAPDPAQTDVPEAAAGSEDFLGTLVAAMRTAAEEARQTSAGDARAAADVRISELRDAAVLRGQELRDRADLDVQGIEEWSQVEIARIEGETARKIEQRRHQLEVQLGDHERRTEAEIAALDAGVEQHERDLASFFAQLTEIADPGAFIAAARRMPAFPALRASAQPVADAGEGPTLDERLRSLGLPTRASEEPPAAPAAEPPTPDAPPSAEVGEAPPSPAEGAASDMETAIMVKGFPSFGAVTGFKQALEKSAGVQEVSLSLSPGGEFVYRALHPSSLDLAGLIGSIQAGASVETQPDGSLRVTVGR